MILEKGLNIIGEFLKDEFRNELLQQDHDATGRHLKSISFETTKTAGGFELVFSSLPYGIDLNNGTGGGRFVPIPALIEWIQAKGMASGDQEMKSMAFAIRQNIYKNGTPSESSYIRSKNGRRKEWIDFTVNKNKAIISNKLALIIGENLDIVLNNIATNINSVL